MPQRAYFDTRRRETMADINNEIKINAAPQAIYQALTNASELAKQN
jgi:hypothetical protein